MHAGALTRVLVDLALVGLAEDLVAPGIEVELIVGIRRAKVHGGDGLAGDLLLEEGVELLLALGREGGLGRGRDSHGINRATGDSEEQGWGDEGCPPCPSS